MRTKVMLLLVLLLTAASAMAVLLLKKETPAPTARVTRDGVVLEEIDLTAVEAPFSLTLEDGRGTNTLLVEPGRVRISEADCPDRVCVNQGWISDGTVPIVCLPHRLIVEIVDGGGELDGAAG